MSNEKPVFDIKNPDADNLYRRVAELILIDSGMLSETEAIGVLEQVKLDCQTQGLNFLLLKINEIKEQEETDQWKLKKNTSKD